MTDDLSTLTPTDPTTVATEWSHHRQRILDGILAADQTRRPSRRRWVTGAAAAIVVIGAVGGIAQLLQPEPYATPASPTASPTSALFSPDDPVMLDGTLMEVEGVMGICHGQLLTGGQTDPLRIDAPRCERGFVPVTGIELPGFGDREGQVVGTFGGSVFRATRWYGGSLLDHENLIPENGFPMPSATTAEPQDMCEEQPGSGTLSGEAWSPAQVSEFGN